MGVAARWLPPRMRGIEHLDDPALDPALALRSLRDIRWANRLFGGTSAILGALRPILTRNDGARWTVLDVGTGAGDVPAAVRALAEMAGVPVATFGLEWTWPLAQAASRRAGPSLAGDARRLPFASRSVDIVICSQVLHHFDETDGRALISELHRVARRAVVIGEIRRSWLAAAGIWLASWPLGFHPVSRHDGVVSVFRGFTRDELGTAVRAAVGVTPLVRASRGFRLAASWTLA